MSIQSLQVIMMIFFFLKNIHTEKIAHEKKTKKTHTHTSTHKNGTLTLILIG